MTLVSCLMPTYNRRPFLPRAIAYFQRQTHPNRELIILDDGEDAVADLVPADPAIRYERLPRRLSLGAKLNLGCEMAGGDLIAHFDDDDWYAPWRLAYQVEAMAGGAVDICGINHLLYFDMRHARAYEYRYPPGHPVWLLGSEMLYTRAFWRARRFADINVGMDGLFAWSADPQRILTLDRHDFAVHMIHDTNVSPKQTDGPWWHAQDVATIADTLGADWHHYSGDQADGREPREARSRPPSRQPAPSATIASVALAPGSPSVAIEPAPLRNVHACLVHERPDCVIDLVANLRHLDPASRILLYDGSAQGDLLDPRLPWVRWGAEICPRPRPMRWGQLHGFALDCLRHLGADFDTLTIVDSDQLALRPGYGAFLGRHLAGRTAVGLLSSQPARQGPDTTIAPCVTAQSEAALWRPFLRRFAGGEDKFAYWSFWPGTVILREAGQAVLDLFDRDRELAAILERSRLWATEEVLFPTLTALLGFEVAANPCADRFNKYRVAFGERDLAQALATPSAFFIHPVPRAYGDPLRAGLRAAHGGYRTAPATPAAPPPSPALVTPILRAMRAIDGWLEDEEAELLLLVARACLVRARTPARFVEIGCYCGKATTMLGAAAKAADGAAPARILAVDRFDGVVGALGSLEQRGPTLDRFRATLVGAGIADIVDIAVGAAADVRCEEAVTLLLVDGWHDYASVATDFHAFADRLTPDARVAFHDYAPWFPDVVRFADELCATGAWAIEAQAGTLVVLRRQVAA